MPPLASTAAACPDPDDTDWPAPSPLAAACRALWLATLGLMTAYMQVQGPAHRVLLARRIAFNLETLSQQESFGADCRGRFRMLASRWQARAASLAPRQDRRRDGTGRLPPA
jgi:hypothetical protein